MKTEFRLGVRTSTRPDFVEGVRAVLVDKDQVRLRNVPWHSLFVIFDTLLCICLCEAATFTRKRNYNRHLQMQIPVGRGVIRGTGSF
jgi:hypothetical protein